MKAILKTLCGCTREIEIDGRLRNEIEVPVMNPEPVSRKKPLVRTIKDTQILVRKFVLQSESYRNNFLYLERLQEK